MNKKIISNIRNLLLVLLAIFLPFSVAVTNIIVVFLFISVLVEGEYRVKINKILSSKWMISLILLLILYYFSFFIYGQFSDTIWILKRVSILWTLPILYSVSFSKKTIYKSVFSFLLSMFFSSLIAISENLSLINLNGENWTWSAFLKYTDHNVFLAVSIIISIFSIYKLKIQGKYKKSILFFLPFYIFSIFTEAGKSGQILLVLLLILLFLYFFKRNFKKFIISVTVLFVGLFLIFNTSEIVEKRYTENIKNSRSNFLKYSLQLIHDNPVLGYGAGSFRDVFGEINLHTKKLVKWQHKTPHNNYFYVWIELGSLGLIFLLSIFYFQLRELYQEPHGFIRILLPIMYLCLMIMDSYLFNQNTLILYVFLSVIVINYQYRLS